ncbi:MAG: SH3 domain-containing protein [Clostridiales bacterium]|nr:SH3 domain-containing protein [Clostridiales bacterium]
MKRIISLLLCLLCVIAGMPCGMAETNTQLASATIDGGNGDRVHLRAEPSTKATSLGLYFTGTQVLCELDSTGEWTKVIIGAESGYMKSKFLRLGNDQGNVRSKQPFGNVEPINGVNLRSAPSLEAQVDRKLERGNAVTILGETASHWYYVSASDCVGYVSAKYISITNSAEISDVPDINMNPGDLKLYQLVLNNESQFFSTSDRTNLYLGQLNGSFDGLPVTFTQFAVVDLDADGMAEIVVALSVNGNAYYGYEVLDAREGKVYGYDLVYRALEDLKADGTFSYASGVEDTGFGTLKLGDKEYSIEPIAYSEPAEDGHVDYVHNGMPITDEAYRQLCDIQEKKAPVTWYEFTDENIEKLFGHRY